MGDRLPPRTQGNWEGADWSRLDVPALWHTISQENDTYTRLQVSAWARTYDVLDAYRAKLEALADALAEYWPPTLRSSAAAYQRVVVGLVSGVRETSHDASGNALALGSVVDTLMAARAHLESLNERWQSAPPKSAAAMRPVLQQQAVKAMTEADQASYDYASALTVPDRYVAGFQAEVHSDIETEGANVSHSSLTGLSSSGPGSAGSGVALPVPAGNSTPVASTPPILSGGSWPPDTPPTSAPTPAGPPSNNAPVQPQWSGALPVGGVFGSSPGLGRRRDVPGVKREQTERPASGRGHAAVPEHVVSMTEENGTHGPFPGVPGAAGLGAGRSDRRRPTGDPDTEWAVARGVPSVFEAAPESDDHNPGPGVWGIDR